VLEDTERRIARVRKAVAKIRQVCPQLPSLGTRRFAFTNAEPMCDPEEGLALTEPTNHEAKTQRASQP
jgi:hypothetical protein